MTSASARSRKADALLALHTGGSLLVLPNIWNPIGARILEAKGYPAVATASAAVSTSLGYRDGEKIKLSTLLDILARIARSVDIPVTADIETGYGSTLSELRDTMAAVIDAGIVGINIEDGLEEDGALRSIEDQCARLSAVRDFAGRQGLHLVINARIDSYLTSSFASIQDATEDAVSRAEAYAKAGADCVYPIGPGDEETVRELRARIVSPINILGAPSAAALPVLESIGVNRVSFGPFLLRACLRKFSDIADDLKIRKDHSGLKDMLTKSEAAEYLLAGPE